MKKMFLILVVLLFTITFNACSDSEHSSYINISSDEIEANYKSEEYSINIESNCEWQILTDAQWIDVKDMLSGSGNQKLTFSIKANTEYDERESYLTINSLDGTTSASIRIKQMGKNGVIAGDTPNNIEIQSTGGSFNINVMTNTETNIKEKPNWIHIQNTRSLSEYSWNFYAEENTTGKTRYGTIVISGGEDNIRYSIAQNSIDILATKIEFEQDENIIIDTNNPIKLIPIFYPDNCNQRELSYTSNDTSIVEVNNNGELTPITNGVTTIVATNKNSKLSTSIQVTVKIKATEIMLKTEDGYNMYQNQFGLNSRTPINLSVIPENAYTGDIIYIPENKNLISIENGYFVTNSNIGETIINIKDQYSGCTTFLNAQIDRAFFWAGHESITQTLDGFIFVLRGGIKGGVNDFYEVRSVTVVDENNQLIAIADEITQPSNVVKFKTGELNFTELFNITTINSYNLPKLRFLISYKWNKDDEIYYEYVNIDLLTTVS